MGKNRQEKEFVWPPPYPWFTVCGALVVIAVISALAQILLFFMSLHGTRWIAVFAIGLGLATIGAGLIFFAKLPLYRERHFLTFGAKALPEARRPYYRWGYCCVGLGQLLLLGLQAFGRS